MNAAQLIAILQTMPANEAIFFRGPKGIIALSDFVCEHIITELDEKANSDLVGAAGIPVVMLYPRM